MSEIEQKVTECFENVFPDVPPTELQRCSQASVAAWDSLAHMTLLAAISERFEIDMDFDTPEELISFALIVDHLEERRQNA